MQGPIFGIEKQDQTKDYGRFIIEPLERGWGHTFGTSLRRVLLSNLPGAAITQVRIAGMKHQYSTLPGVKEDGVDLLLNIKQIRLAYDGEKPVKITLSARGKKEVKAGDIETPPTVTIANPDFVIAHLADSKSKLDIEMQVESGIGYRMSEKETGKQIGVILLDADFSPVKRVAYKVEETRVGRETNYDRLILDIWTDGSITPKEALDKAVEQILTYFKHFTSPSKIHKPKPIQSTEVDQAANLSVEELALPTRVANALIKGGYETVEDILKAGKEELTKIRNLGAKSIKTIEVVLKEKGYSWKE